MTQRLDRIVIVAADALRNRQAGMSVQHLHEVSPGRDVEIGPVPLSEVELGIYSQQWNAGLVVERDQLLTDKAALESQVTTLTSERDLALSQVVTLNDSLAATIIDRDGVTAERDSLTQELVTVTTDRDAKAQRVIELEGQLEMLLHPPGPDLTTRDGVRQYVSNARYVAETGGIYVGNQFISTERDEIGHWFPRFYNALMWLQGDPRIRAANPDGHYPFKPKNHPPTVLTAEQVLRAYECMAWYINACFAVEATLYARLNNEAPLDVIVTDTATAWPSNHFTWEPPA